MSSARSPEVILHYYPGRGGWNAFGHVALEYGGRYYSFGIDTDYADNDVAGRIKSETATYSGTHIALHLPAPANTINLQGDWQSHWKAREYHYLTHNCAHSAVYCLQQLGLLQQGPALQKLHADLALRAIIRPAEVFAALRPLSRENIEEQHSQLASTSHLNDILQALIDDEIVTDVIHAMQKIQPKLQQALESCHSISGVKMVLQKAIISEPDPAQRAELTVMQERLSATYPGLKSCIQSILAEECRLYLQKDGKQGMSEKSRFYADLLRLSEALTQPHCTLDWLYQEIADGVLQRHKPKVMEETTLTNLVNSLMVIRHLTRDEKKFDEYEFSVQQAQRHQERRQYDDREQLRTLSLQVEMAIKLLDNNRQIEASTLTVVLDHLHREVDDALENPMTPEAYKKLQETLMAMLDCIKKAAELPDLFPPKSSYSMTTPFLKALSVLEDKLPEAPNLKDISDFTSQCLVLMKTQGQTSPVAKEQTGGPQSRHILGKLASLQAMTSDTSSIQAAHLDWLQYKLFNLLFWYGQSSHKENFKHIMTLISQVYTTASGSVLMSSEKQLRSQLQVLQDSWDLKRIKYKKPDDAATVNYLNEHPKDHTFTRELGLVIASIEKILSPDGSILSRELDRLAYPYGRKIGAGSYLDQADHVSSLFLRLTQDILLLSLPSSEVMSHLKRVTHSLSRFTTEGILTPRQALLELVTEVDHAQAMAGKEAALGKAMKTLLAEFDKSARLSLSGGGSHTLFVTADHRAPSPSPEAKTPPMPPGSPK